MLNSRDVGLLRPDVAANCRLWLDRCAAVGLQVLVTSTVRDSAYQAWLYEQGRSRPGTIVTNSPTPTFHSDQAGLAFDFCKNVKGQEYSDREFFRKAADLAKEMGFSWGGDWRSFQGLRMATANPQLEAATPLMMLYPAVEKTSETPSVSCRIFWTFVMTSFVRSSDAASGS